MSPPRFDWTVNLGHVLIILGMIASVLLAWSNLDKRVTLAEDRLKTETATRDVAVKWLESRMNRRSEQTDKRFETIQKALRRIEDKIDRKADK